MIKYYTTACALKLFSLSAPTRQMYRILGNTVGARRRVRTGLPAGYIVRANWLLSLFEKYNVRHEGAKLLELGTGWMHWDAVVIRLFYNAQCTLFDVWDNRQFQAFHAYASGLLDVFDDAIEIGSSEHSEAKEILRTIVSISCFEELYELLGFQYVVEPAGTLQKFEHNTYDVCFSYNVFEHINGVIISDYVRKLYHLLKPGGYSFMRIDMSDHLAHFDQNVCRKNYLRYSDTVWMRFFENDVQYFNRIQRGEWLKLFSEAGFMLVEEEVLSEPINTSINKKYEHLSRKDIECTILKLVHQKPFK